MIFREIIIIFGLVLSVSCDGFNNVGYERIYYPGEGFQMGNIPYQPYAGPLRGDVNSLQVRGVKPEEMPVVKQPSTVLEPPNPNNQQILNRNAEVAIENKKDNVTATNVQYEKASSVLSSFGLDLIKDISQSKAGNSVVSPFSIAILLSLLQQGASGNSLKQISNALHLQPQESAEIFKILGEEIKKRDSNNVLEIANNVFVAGEFELSKKFKGIATNNFRSDVTPLSFQDGALASKFINDWVADKTRDKITNLIAPDAIGQNTQMVLLNAMYFKGLWKIKFNPNSTAAGKFHLRDGKTINTPFMKSYFMYKAGYDPRIKAEIVILPFENEDYSMMVLLPTGIDEMEYTLSALSKINLKEYHDKLKPQELKLEIPKFNIKAQVDLIPILRKMGITDVFGWNPSLNGIGLYRNSSPRIDNAIHSAVLSIDEQGGTAAAATAFTVIALMYDDTQEIKVNRPFVAVFWDNKLSIPLFVARIEDPSK